LGFFARWKAKRDLKKAIKRVKKNPSPRAAADLIEKYISAGQLDNASLMAKQSLEYYPASPCIQDSFRLFKKAKYQEEIRRLTQQIKERPNPSAYGMLAELYGEIGETDKTLDICREAIRKFPDYEGTYLIVGKIRYRRYREEGLPRDGLLAVEFFEKALKLNAKNYKTLMQLGEIYLELGMPAKSTEKFKSVTYFAPEDERAKELLEYAQTLPPETDADIEDHFKELKEQRDAEKVERRTSRFSIEELEAKLAEFEPFEGFLAVMITTSNGRQLASRLESPQLDEEAVRNAVSAAFRAADDSSLRMDIGGFEQGIVSGQHFMMNIFKFENLVCAVLASAQIKPDIVQAAVDTFVDDVLYASVGA
jgi:tetratricopeptide (TPR) repeat protein